MTQHEYNTQRERVNLIDSLTKVLRNNLNNVDALEDNLKSTIQGCRGIVNEKCCSRLAGWIKSISDEERVRLKEEYNESALEV